MEETRQHTRTAWKTVAICTLAGCLLVGAGCSDDGAGKSPPGPSPQASTPAGGGAAKPAPTPTPAATPTPPAEESRADLIARGRSVYMANCIACHSQNPAMDGALGPAVAGSSHALIEARVIHGEYPPGYTPKRDSRVMIALPHLADQIDALTAYLDSVSS